MYEKHSEYCAATEVVLHQPRGSQPPETFACVHD